MANSQNRRNTSGSSKSNRPQGRAGQSKGAVDKNRAMANARKATAKSNNQTIIWAVASVVVLALIAVGIFAVINQNRSKEEDRIAEVQTVVDEARGSMAGDVPPPTVTDGVVSYGAADAPVTVEYWVDLLCPACKSFEVQAAEAMEQYIADGTVKLDIHAVGILDQASNPAGYSTRSASAFMCAANQATDNNDSYVYLKSLYELQPPERGPGLTDEKLVEIGTASGLGNEFEACVKEQTYADAVAANTQQFDANGFPGTPTVLVNGTQLQSNSVSEMTAAIEAAK